MDLHPRSSSLSPPRDDLHLHLESESEPPPSSQISAYANQRTSSPDPKIALDAPAEPPRAPRRMRAYLPHDDRPVTPPPTQTPPSDYLALAFQPPSHLTGDPSSSRKLLILDLNGTLLHRATVHPPRRDRRDHRSGDGSTGATGRPLPRLRPVHPRPYMPSFHNFLFAPQTKEWLDAMIWSSAQPYSVDDMVDKTFGESKTGLIAIWARDTLGLTEQQYNRKVQTFKDLSKPWAEIPSLSPLPEQPNLPPTPHSISSTPHNSPRPSSPLTLPDPSSPELRPPPESPQAHSAMTTLLLDDSPRKAELQPYNHICISEYSGATRAKDLEAFHQEKNRNQQEADRLAQIQADVPTEDGIPAESGKKRKRKGKKRLKQQHGGESKYDETLVAVIGVLDEIKTQANVAAWIRLGGLWADSAKPTEVALSAPSKSLESPTLVPIDEGGPKEDGYASGGSDLSVDGTRAGGKRIRKRSSPNGGVEDKPPAGNDAVTSAASPAVDKSSATGVVGEPVEGSPPAAMWFEDATTLQYWVSRGKKALEDLGIALEHGIER